MTILLDLVFCFKHYLGHRPTQFFTLSRMVTEYRQRAVKLYGGSKGRYSSFHLWIKSEWQVKLCNRSLTRAIPECLRDKTLTIKCYTKQGLL